MEKNDAITKLNNLFEQLKLKASVVSCKKENSFFIFEIILKSGGTFKKLERFSTEIALALKSLSEPLIYPITRKGVIRIEVMEFPLKDVLFKDIIDNKEFVNTEYKLPLALGSRRDSSPLVLDLKNMPHLLIGGATGSGKSILLQVIINSLLVKAKNFKLALIDTKRVEFSYYDKLPYLFGPIAKDADNSLQMLNSLIEEMESRFMFLEKKGYRNIDDCKGMDYIVVIIDELADLMMSSKKDAQDLICRLAQKSRACGIHMIIATQRPSVDVVTGVIKANFPSRISCQVSSSIDSRTILDKNGAEKLSGKGDSILVNSEYRFERFKGSYISENEIINNSNIKSWWNKIWNF